jgi:Na+/H+-dicarboxylate symporter
MGAWRGELAILCGALGFLGLRAAGLPRPGYGLLLLGGVLFSWTSRIGQGWQIGIGIALGVALGLLDADAASSIGFAGKLFIAMLRMMIAPMILFSVAHGVAQLGAGRDLGRIGARTIGLYLLTMVLAGATGLTFVNALEPGAGGQLRETDFFRESVAGARPEAADRPLGEFLLSLAFEVLQNPIASLASGSILPVVVFAALLGLAVQQIGARARPVAEVLEASYLVVMRMIGWALRLAPVGIFALLAPLVATVGLRQLAEQLGAFAGTVILATSVHAFLTLPVLAWLLGGVSPLRLLVGLRDALAVAFSTSSSAATLPVSVRCVEEQLGVPQHISSFVLPLGATVNMDGTALYEALAAVFVANVYGIELGLGGQLVVLVMAILMAMGAPGIPSAGMVTMIVVLEAVGLPGEAVGMLLTIDRVLDTFRTMANVEGDAVVAVIVARSVRTREQPPTGATEVTSRLRERRPASPR